MTAERDLADLVRDSVVVCDGDGRVVGWNAASVDLYGWTVEQAVGRTLEELTGVGAGESDSLVEQRLERRGSDGRAVLVEARWTRRADGGIVEIGRDVTAQNRTEQALKRSELRYSSLFQAMAAAFWELDFSPVGALLRELKVQGVTDYPGYFAEHPEFIREMMRRTRVVDVNETTLELFGIGDRSRLAASVEPYWPEASSGVYAAAVLAAVGRRNSYMTETRLRRADGGEFDALFTAAFPNEGLAQGALLIGVIDISQRTAAMADLKRLQDDFAHAARVSMLGELTASIAHEVNQPLAAISANASASLRWLDRAEPDVGRAVGLTSRIRDDAQRAADVIARVRSMASKSLGARETLGLRTLVDEVLIFLGPELQHRKAEVRSDVAGLTIHGDRTQLQQVLLNLIMNAVQAAGGIGVAPVLTLTSAESEAGVELRLADNGPGLDEEVALRLFSSFYSTKPDGMGLGLPICRSIIEAHGGEISAANGPDGGAVFLIRLPSDPDHTKV